MDGLEKMMKKVFNTDFENSLRIIILLDIFNLPQTLEKLYMVDFVVQYANVFGMAEEGLNGKNSYCFSEFLSKRQLIKEAVILLVMKGMVYPLKVDNGIGYIITSVGEEYCNALESEYAMEYRDIAHKVIDKLENVDERTLMSYIYDLSIEVLRSEGNE